MGPISIKEELEPSQETMAEMPLELAHDATSRLREAAEMGDVSELKAVAGELKSRSNALRPISDQIIRAAEDFDFESVLTWVKKLEND